ncbi:hypothetical protein MG293_013096 [Ovis ammon polii]|uniref:Tyrosine-protein kinase ephrin type A/B receptor-like domain-containing protein n=1 Tax=Ovis ammon polii TaxID=230172 RepID=A0AAD4Y760_OVIAM|nr:hypothetical protein MG293_013096 [Ovis ammon polii]
MRNEDIPEFSPLFPGTFCGKSSLEPCISCPLNSFSSTSGQKSCDICRKCEGLTSQIIIFFLALTSAAMLCLATFVFLRFSVVKQGRKKLLYIFKQRIFKVMCFLLQIKLMLQFDAMCDHIHYQEEEFCPSASPVSALATRLTRTRGHAGFSCGSRALEHRFSGCGA